MANENRAEFEQAGLDNRREITNTGGTLAEDPSKPNEAKGGRSASSDDHPVTAGRKSGDDAWHNDANRSGDRGDDAEPMRGGDVAPESET